MPSRNTSAHARAQDRKTAFKARQARIIATQSRPGLSVCERLVIAIIGQHENLKTGQCNPGIDTIANECGLNERTVYRAIAGAERKGAIVVTRAGNGGRNRPNGYQLVPAKAVKNPDNRSGKKTLTTTTLNPDNLPPELIELESEGNAKAFPLAGRESEPSVLDSAASGADARGAPPEALGRPESDREPANPSAEEDSGGVHAAWRALVELWAVRPWPMTPRELAIARTLFVKVIADGTPIDVILAGANAWVAAVNDPFFLKALPQWLAARCWEYPPPVKPKRQTGQRRQRREKTDLASLMHELGQTM